VILYETKDGYKYKEFVWADSHWEELGDENSYKIYANELVNEWICICSKLDRWTNFCNSS
jgi:hypothetical protein